MNWILALAVYCTPNATPIEMLCTHWMTRCVISEMAAGEHEIENAAENCVEKLPIELWPESGKERNRK